MAGGLSLAGITAGVNHTCGLASGHVTYCWGSNEYGQLGDGTATWHSMPSSGAGFFDTIIAGTVGNHTCGLHDGAAYCWGRNSSGQLGDGTQTNRSRPVHVGG